MTSIPTAEAPARRTQSDVVWALRRALAGADPGTLAALRRADPEHPPPAFYRMTVDLLDDDGAPGAGSLRDAIERKWVVVVAALCTGRDFLGRVPLGAALAQAGVTEMRLLRMLQASEGTLHDVVRAVVHQLVSKGQMFDPNDLAALILSDGHDAGDTVRRRIARDFYRHEGS